MNSTKKKPKIIRWYEDTYLSFGVFFFFFEREMKRNLFHYIVLYTNTRFKEREKLLGPKER